MAEPGRPDKPAMIFIDSDAQRAPVRICDDQTRSNSS
jgi:hypothetical protein